MRLKQTARRIVYPTGIEPFVRYSAQKTGVPGFSNSLGEQRLPTSISLCLNRDFKFFSEICVSASRAPLTGRNFSTRVGFLPTDRYYCLQMRFCAGK